VIISLPVMPAWTHFFFFCSHKSNLQKSYSILARVLFSLFGHCCFFSLLCREKKLPCLPILLCTMYTEPLFLFPRIFCHGVTLKIITVCIISPFLHCLFHVSQSVDYNIIWYACHQDGLSHYETGWAGSSSPV